MPLNVVLESNAEKPKLIFNTYTKIGLKIIPNKMVELESKLKPIQIINVDTNERK